MFATVSTYTAAREGWCLASLSGALSTRLSPYRHHQRCPLLHLPSRPVRLTLRRTPPLVPLVAKTSDWAPQRGEENNEVESVVDEEGVRDELENGEEYEGWENDDTEAKVAVEEGERDEWENGEEEYEEWQQGPEAKLEEVEDEGVVGEESGGVYSGALEEETYPEPPEEAKLFVGNLPYDMDSENLAKLFDQAGIVEIAEVIYNRETDQSRGFGFVTMSTIEEADKAIDTFHRYDCNGRLLTVNRAAPRGSRPERPSGQFEPSFRLYVGNLPWQVDDSRLEQVFSEHGKVVDARVIYDRDTGRSRGFGFVTMSTRAEVDDAIAALDGQSLDGRAVRVNVAEERSRRSNSF